MAGTVAGTVAGTGTVPVLCRTLPAGEISPDPGWAGLRWDVGPEAALAAALAEREGLYRAAAPLRGRGAGGRSRDPTGPAWALWQRFPRVGPALFRVVPVGFFLYPCRLAALGWDG